ncbi:hypothetical protein HAX54_018690 [Datura stramonium]|uniref:Uncharacterized protein n=1 Tax=Datura stramonium TaxID=4076 RepID=A0ABS8UPT9_DATST|nr:hypothetical protein [Datura stramonium]
MKYGSMYKAEEEAYGIVMNSFEELEQEYVKGLMNAKGKKIWTIGPRFHSQQRETDKAERGNKAAIDEHQGFKMLDSGKKTMYEIRNSSSSV